MVKLCNICYMMSNIADIDQIVATMDSNRWFTLKKRNLPNHKISTLTFNEGINRKRM